MSDKSLSEAARNFLQQNLLRNPPLRNSIELPDSHNIERIRRETREGYRVAFESSRRQYTSSDQDISVGGVPCLEINPRYRDQNRGNVVIFYLFGGGYIMGSPEEDLPISAFVANGLGVRTVCPYYRLSPEHVYPAAFNDVFAVYVALTREYGHGQILVVGESAGGHLALQILLAACADGMKLPGACALLSPWADISQSGDSVNFNDGRDPTLSASLLKRAAEMFAPGMDHTDKKLSPLFSDYPANFPPTFISTGTRDLLMSNAVRLSRRMRRSEIEVQLTVWEQLWHVFEFYPQIPEAAESLGEICNFLERNISISSG